MNPLIFNAILPIIGKIFDKVLPDDIKLKAKTELINADRSNELDDLKKQLSVVLAEAQSTDNWTSRARPSFLYVVYFLILWSIPMGILTIFRPTDAIAFVAGFNAWLSAIPEPMLTMFGWVMTGYTVGRSWEKIKGVSK